MSMPMSFEDLYHDRRPPRPEPDNRPEPEQVEQGQVHTTADEPKMTEDMLLDSIRFPSAIPGPGVMVMGRVRDRDLCRHCMQPLFNHGAGVYEHHLPEPMPNGQRTPGTHSDIEDGRSRNTAGSRPTPRRDFD